MQTKIERWARQVPVLVREKSRPTRNVPVLRSGTLVAAGTSDMWQLFRLLQPEPCYDNYSTEYVKTTIVQEPEKPEPDMKDKET